MVVRSFSFEHPVIGQEAICPDGLGRVVAFMDVFPQQWIQIDTYVGNRSCRWDHQNVELIPIQQVETPPVVDHFGDNAFVAFVVRSSDLGNRWDAEFHQFRAVWQDRADAIRGSIAEDKREEFERQIIDQISDQKIFDLEALSVFKPLLTGRQQASRDAIIKAAGKHPYIVAAVLSSEVMDSVLETKQQALHERSEALARTRTQLGSMFVTPNRKTRSP